MRKSKENISVMNKASGAENINASEAPENAANSFGNNNKKIINFPNELIKRMQYEIKKTINTRDDFQRIAFVSKALTTDKHAIRKYESIIKVETDEESGNVTFIATDGRRIHLAQINHFIPEGYYNIMIKGDVITLQEVIDSDGEIQYPNYRKIIPGPETLKKICDLNLDQTGLTKNMVKTGKISLEFAKIIKRAKKVMNIRFLDDLAKIDWELYVEEKREKGPLCFKLNSEKELLAIIMPMNDDD
jgi:hypothetical protein